MTGSVTGLIILAVALAGCAAPTIPPTPTAAPSPETLTLTGSADTNTAPFTLAADTYLSSWTKALDCTFGAYLKSPTDANFSRPLGGSYSDGPLSGETWVYHVGPGTYYAQVQGRCAWTIELASR